jgi:branched-chain amino acid transport system substrate-binding protein
MSNSSDSKISRRTVLKGIAGAGAVLAGSSLGFPAIVRAVEGRGNGSGPIKLGHLTPRTGFLGQLGEYGLNASRMAVDEINAAGGVMGRPVVLLAEDSVKPGVAVNKVDQLINRDGAVALLGEISSSTALAIGEAAMRNGRLYINTGANSDALRGENCNRYMFHVEGCNTMYTKTIGQWQVAQDMMDGARWYFLTADYAFGHDLRRVSQRFFKDHGGEIIGDDLVPTGTTDYSAYILKIRQARPDMIYLNLAGTDQTTFLKQYNEYGLSYPLSGGVMDTAQFWAAGLDNLSGHWQSLWYHGIDNPSSRKFVENYQKRYGTMPENQAWGDYTALRILAQAMQETQSTRSEDLIAYLEGGAQFDVMKDRPARFRDWDHQLLQEMYVVEVKDPSASKDQWDIFNIVEAVPGKGEDLAAIQPTKEENACSMAI